MRMLILLAAMATAVAAAPAPDNAGAATSCPPGRYGPNCTPLPYDGSGGSSRSQMGQSGMASRAGSPAGHSGAAGGTGNAGGGTGNAGAHGQ
jgi:hypothetical protein